jgi:hypothetical protein
MIHDPTRAQNKIIEPMPAPYHQTGTEPTACRKVNRSAGLHVVNPDLKSEEHNANQRERDHRIARERAKIPAASTRLRSR